MLLPLLSSAFCCVALWHFVGGYFAMGKSLDLFAWHPILMMSAFLGLMPLGIYALRRKLDVEVHKWLQIAAAVLAIVGTVVEVVVRQRAGKRHFWDPAAPWHSQLGALAVALVVAQCVFALRPELRRTVVRRWHAQLGAALVVLGVAACMLKWTKYHAHSSPWMYCLYVLGSIALCAAALSTRVFLWLDRGS